MVHKHREFNLRVLEVEDSTTGETVRKFSWEVFAGDDTDFQNPLDKTWVTVKRTDSAAADVVMSLMLFIEYVDKCYLELSRAAEAPLDNVVEDAFQRSFDGWTFNEVSLETPRDNCRKDVLEDLGFC